MLDMDESRLQALATPEQRKVESVEASRQESVKNPEKHQAEQVKMGFVSRLKTKLEHVGNASTGTGIRQGILNKSQAFASCSRCGFQILQPTRFCQRCGADFGKLLCSCGRELGAGDKFCDRCGRTL